MAKSPDEFLVVELAHVLWFDSRGQHIDNSSELEESWADDCQEFIKIASKLLTALEARGIGLEYVDVSRSQFVK